MKDKIKNGYFFECNNVMWMRVGSRCYMLPTVNGKLYHEMFKNIEESKITKVFKPNGERII